MAHGQLVNSMATKMEAADEELVQREGAWEIARDPVGGPSVHRRLIELVPKSETKPALSVQFIPNDFQRKEGNAALFYLQAMGFFEQSAALQAKQDFERKSRETAVATGQDMNTVPPYAWMQTRPSELPINEVKQYLVYTSFQPRYLAEAVMRKDFSLDRRIDEIDNPIGTLIPEIQVMRELARQQQMRYVLALAEGRTDDAVEILGQQLAMGAHLAQDHFLVSALVGIACASIGLGDAYYLCEQPDAPNLYWAVATLPKPLVDLRPALAYERELLFLQFKPLGEVDENPRADGYWTEFVKELAEFTNELGMNPRNQELDEATVTLGVAIGLPGAKRYLLEVVGMKEEQLAKLPNTQVFALAMRRYSEYARDEMFKQFFAPDMRNELDSGFGQQVQSDSSEYGLITVPAGLLLPAVQAAESAQRRLQQQLALLQTVEAIRHHLATSGGELPKTLGVLELPAPRDPATDNAFEYQVKGKTATLTGGAFPGLRYELVLKAKD